MSTASPFGRIMMFDGFTSRWIASWRWRECRAVPMAAPSLATSAGSIGPALHHSESERPSICSITMNGRRARSPAATNRGTCGPFTAESTICSTSRR
jgi:hypothetical protein